MRARYGSVESFVRGQSVDKWGHGSWVRKTAYGNTGIDIVLRYNNRNHGMRIQYFGTNVDEEQIFVSTVHFDHVNIDSRGNTDMEFLSQSPIQNIKNYGKEIVCPECQLRAQMETRFMAHHTMSGTLYYDVKADRWSCSSQDCNFSYSRDTLRGMLNNDEHSNWFYERDFLTPSDLKVISENTTATRSVLGKFELNQIPNER